MNYSDLIIAVIIFLAGIGIGLYLTRSMAAKQIRQERSTLNNNHRKEQKALAFENNLLKQGQETILLVLDEKKNIALANNAAHDFLHQKKLTGKAIKDYCKIPELLEVIDENMQSKDPLKRELQVNLTHRGNTEEAFLSVNVKRISGESENTYIRVIIQDITDKRLNEIIHKDFVANASHELRTPLTIINGYVETLLDDEETLKDTETTHYFLNIMKRHGKRLTRIVEEMLMITKLDSGLKDILKTELFSFKECVDDCLSHLDHMIKERNTEIQITLSDPDLQIKGDRFYWSQILFNLIENAIKQNPDHPVKIEIGSKKEANKVEIWVTDNGIGIPNEDIPYIFKRFYRVAKDHSQQKIKGTGLGLSIVKRAVEAHEGTIQCHSDQGKSTRFLMTLPA